jgi:hypothetical protein
VPCQLDHRLQYVSSRNFKAGGPSAKISLTTPSGSSMIEQGVESPYTSTDLASPIFCTFLATDHGLCRCRSRRSEWCDVVIFNSAFLMTLLWAIATRGRTRGSRV